MSISVKSQTKVIDHGYKKLMTNLTKLGTKEVRVGLFEDDQSADGTMTMADLGTLMEYGDTSLGGYIPPRPFMRDTAVNYEDQIGDYMVSIVDDMMFLGLDVKQVLTQVGDNYSDMTKTTIERFSNPPNSVETIAMKGRNDPLVDTGKMKDSVKFKVSNKL